MLEFIKTYTTHMLVITTTLVVIAAYMLNIFAYWRKKNVPYIPVTNFLDKINIVRNAYNYAKLKSYKFFGIFLFTEPTLVLTDLDLIKSIMVKDFQHFDGHGNYYNEKDDPLSAHLFSLDGPKWKKLRVKMTPTFTSGKMKMMFHLILECSKQLVDYVEKNSGNNTVGIDCKEILARFTTDVIGSCAFGLKCNSLSEEETPFRKYGKKVFNSNFVRATKFMLVRLFPNAAKYLRLKVVREDVSEFFINIIRETVEYREKNNEKRNDFLQLLIDMKNNTKENDKQANSLTFEELAAQCFVFFLAGFETSSSLMTFCLYELTLNEEIQEKVRDEINTVLERHNGEITYESVMEMTYLGSVLEETLRKYSPLSVLPRKCSLDYVIPNTDISIEKGTFVLIPIHQIHHDPEYYPEPDKFKPERFSAENKPHIPPYAYIPFGEGPRICIGLRFGIMQAKVGIINLLKNFRFTVNSRSTIPIEFAKHSNLLQPKDKTFYLDAHKIY